MKASAQEANTVTPVLSPYNEASRDLVVRSARPLGLDF